jgi:alpha-D-ribose 1-methylphosphonate 5-triphosphate synthase subunit PhnH
MTRLESGIATELRDVGPAFNDPLLSSQAVFRAALEALSRPGRVQAVPNDAHPPAGAAPAAAGLMLALLDPDCTLWLAPRLAAGPTSAWLRFHTGCRIVQQPDEARFAWTDADQLPALHRFAQGSEFEPEASTTCLIQVDGLDSTCGWTLRGPGIRDRHRLAIKGLGASFIVQWQANHALFPRGIDVLLCAGETVAGLARTTTIED